MNYICCSGKHLKINYNYMNSSTSTMFKEALTHAAIISGVIIVHSIIVDVLGWYYATYNMIAGNIIPIVGISYAIYAYRKENCNDTITYSKALGYGVLVSLFLGLVLTVFAYVHTHYISPELYEMGLIMAEERMLDKGVDESQIEMAMEMSQKFKTPFFSILFGTIMMVIVGLIISLIAAAFLKKEPANPFEGVE